MHNLITIENLISSIISITVIIVARFIFSSRFVYKIKSSIKYKRGIFGLSRNRMSMVITYIARYSSIWILLIILNILQSLYTHQSNIIFTNVVNCVLILMFINIFSNILHNKKIRVLGVIAIFNIIFQMLDVDKSVSNTISNLTLDMLFIKLSLKRLIDVIIYGYALFVFTDLWCSVSEKIVAKMTINDDDKVIVIRVSKYIGYVISFIIFLRITLIDIKQFAFITGALSFGVGFGLQKIFANFVSGLSIILEKKIRVNDLIILPDGKNGYVRKIDIRSTIVEDFAGEHIIVPNETFLINTITNMTLESRRHGIPIEFTVRHGTDLSFMYELCKKIGEQICGDGNFSCRIENINDYGIIFYGRIWADDLDNQECNIWQMKSNYLIAIDSQFKKHGIVFATKIIDRNV